MGGFSGRVRGAGGLRWVLAGLLAGTLGTAAADTVDTQLAAYEVEAQRIASDLPKPNQLTPAAGQRRLVDAQLAYAMGDYDAAAVALFELASKPGSDREAATFYLAESLFQKTDRGAARGYYEQVVAGGNVASKYYQPSLTRLIEIAIVQKDNTSVAGYVTALDRVTPALRLPSVPYTRGKLAYAQGKPDEAIAFFQEVPKGSDYELQAAYYSATAYVAKKDLQRATDIFTDLTTRKPRTANDRRILELSQLALGRLYYERDQPTKSIDAYLMIDRRSQLFPDALYEVGWVYVKSKQYDKALRALELLSQSDPQSTKTPTVRILEGNLRVRKAQMIRTAQIQGTLDNRIVDDPATEYDKAMQVFTDTHDMYMPSYAALAQIVDSGASPAQYLTQIAGRWDHVFQATAPLPEAAVQYLREEPEIQRVVAVETDLGEITANLAETEATVARLQGVLAAGDKGAVYPMLSSRRVRIGLVEADLVRIRGELADQQLQLLTRGKEADPASVLGGPLASAAAARKQQLAAYQAMPNPEQAASENLAERTAQYDAIDDSVLEIDGTIGATQAMSVALRKYTADMRELPTEQKRSLVRSLDDAAREAEAIENELDVVRRETQIGRDLAGLGDAAIAGARAARTELRAAEDAEHKLLAGMASSSRDPGRSQQLSAQAERAARLADQLQHIDHEIDGIIDQGLHDIRGLLASARTELAAYKAELASYEAETRAFGGGLLGASFETVKDKFYDIVIRTDVGNVDVAWSQKEDSDDDLKRLNLSRQRELKQLRDEFKDILDGGTQRPSAPAATKPEMPQPEPIAPSGSPDKGAGDQRIAPGGDRAAPPAPPPVRPEDAKPDPKKAAPKKAAPSKTAPKGASK